MKTIPYSTQNINKSDLNIVNSALKKELLTGGNYVKIFENKINKFIGSKFSVVMNSATSCLLAACNALRLKKKTKFGLSAIHLCQLRIVLLFLEQI